MTSPITQGMYKGTSETQMLTQEADGSAPIFIITKGVGKNCRISMRSLYAHMTVSRFG
jgi:hypothetical protein